MRSLTLLMRAMGAGFYPVCFGAAEAFHAGPGARAGRIRRGVGKPQGYRSTLRYPLDNEAASEETFGLGGPA
jgi:hypothetical protein